MEANYSVFDIIGPQMIGPSSSHTAGAARLGKIAYRLAGGDVRMAEVILYGSFSTTGRGHGTDRAVAAGLLGLEPDDEKIKNSLELAKQENREFLISFSSEESEHPNTVRIIARGRAGQEIDVTGVSVGGGNIEIRRINGMEVSFGCQYPTLLVFHQDRPGVIHSVVGLLAKENINIAFMHVFRSSKKQDACMVIETDSVLPQKLVEQISAENDEISEVCIL